MVSSPSTALVLLEVSLWRARFPVAVSARAPSFAFSRCGVLGVGCPGDSASLLALESLILEQQGKTKVSVLIKFLHGFPGTQE